MTAETLIGYLYITRVILCCKLISQSRMTSFIGPKITKLSPDLGRKTK